MGTQMELTASLQGFGIPPDNYIYKEDGILGIHHNHQKRHQYATSRI